MSEFAHQVQFFADLPLKYDVTSFLGGFVLLSNFSWDIVWMGIHNTGVHISVHRGSRLVGVDCACMYSSTHCR